MPVFMTLKPFWLIMYRAVHDLRLKMLALGAELKTAQALIMQEDLSNPLATSARVALQLDEDLKENPTLRGFE